GGGLFLHVLAGVLATLLFCGLAKLATVAQVSTWSLRTSAERLEIQLRWTVGAAAAMLGMFFVLRFFEQAALAFAIVSSFLSFAVAYIAALAWELSDLLGAANREVTSFTRLSWLEAEFVRLEAITRQVLELSDRRLPSARAAGIAAVSGLLLCLLPPSLQADPLQHYHLWIDVSGSMAQQEYERLRMVLEDPMPFIASRSVTSLALSSFFSERDALSGPQHLWPIPQHEVPDCTPSETVFTASRRAQEDACAQRRFEALEVWQQEVRQTLDRFRQVLAAIPIDQAKPETCLFPVLDRVASASHASMVITDGGHAACGGSPKEPREVSGRAVIVLVPDRGGSGLLERMARRRSEIERLYPGIVVTESWQVTDGELWESIGAPDLPAER
ncbi:MAG: hypothetical protein MPN21_27855, partial [Thermoanaerobaculia bacterium]|nr:hypothetical protein [Thermoanaerobaculia bacterium]